jgi:hypothetical protein
MAQLGKKNDKGGETGLDEAITRFVERLGDEHRMLIVLKTQLYGGSWDPMLDDLKNRLTGKPYIFKLVNRIKDDVERIEYMRSFEKEYDIDLSNYVDLGQL